MKFSRILGAIAMVAICITVFAKADDAGAFKQYIPKVTQKLTEAFETKNIGIFKMISTDDFTYTDSKGNKTNKEQSLKGLEQMMNMSKSIKVRIQYGAVKAVAGGVQTDCVMKMTNVMMGPDKKPHTMDSTTWTRELWVRSGKVFKVKSIKDTKPQKVTMDGKPFDPSMMGGGH